MSKHAPNLERPEQFSQDRDRYRVIFQDFIKPSPIVVYNFILLTSSLPEIKAFYLNKPT